MATGNLSSLATRYSTITGELPKTGIVMTCNIYYIATALSLTPKLGRNIIRSLARALVTITLYSKPDTIGTKTEAEAYQNETR